MPFLIALLAAIVVTPVAGWLGRAVGLVNHPDGDPLKIHSAPVAVVGGAAVLGSAFATLALLHGAPPAGVGIAVAIAFALGLVDDARGLSVPAQAVVLVGAGIALPLFGAPLPGPGAVGVLLAVALVFACANATNFLDGQDALAGGLAAIAALGLAGLTAGAGDGMIELGLALAGALAGFLLWNRSRLPIFLGNGGAYGIGALLAALALAATDELGGAGLLGAGVCLGVLAFELGFTVARRAASGRALAAGDRLHSYDLLARDLGSRSRVTATFWVLGGLATALGLVVSALPTVPAAIAVAAASGAAAAAGARLWGRAASRAPAGSSTSS